MRIIAVTTGSYPYGEAKTNRNISLLKGLVELNHSIDLYVISPQNKKFAGELKKKGSIEGVRYEYTSNSIKWPKSSFRKMLIVVTSIINLLFKLNKIHSNEKIDALLILLTKPYIIHPFILFAKRKKIKIIHERTEHPAINYSKGKRFISNLMFKYYLYLLPKFSGLYVINKYLVDYFSKYIDKSKICIINMTVDFNRFNKTPPSPFDFKYIAYCGTMHGNKDGLENLIKIYKSIEKKIDMKLVLIGDNQDKRVENVLRIVKDECLEKKIIFTGLIDSRNMPPYLQNAEMLVLARPNNLQAKGGFPTKLGEYLMASKPVIVTSVGEIPLFLEDKKSAYIAEPDNNDDFAQKILYVINNYQKALNVGKEGKMVALRDFNYYNESLKIATFVNKIIFQGK